MRMIGAPCGPICNESINQVTEPFPLRLEVPVARHQELFCRRGISPHRFFVAEGDTLYCRSDDSADQGSSRTNCASGHLKPCRSVREHLHRTHFAPLARAVRSQPVEPRFDFVNALRLKQISCAHAAVPPSAMSTVVECGAIDRGTIMTWWPVPTQRCRVSSSASWPASP